MIIAVWSAKGGVGVSSLSLALAKVMKEEDPLLMDFNLFSPTLSALMGLENTQYGLDRVFLHSDSETIKKALQQNWVQHKDFTILPGVQYPPKELKHNELIMRSIREEIKNKTVIVDAGSGVVHPLQRELLLHADIILIVVTPYLMTYHHLWRMWQNDFFIPYEQIKKSGLIVNQFYGSVTSQDIATLMDLWLAGDLPIVKKMTTSLNQGILDEAFSKPYLRKLSDIINRSIDRMEKTNTMVKQSFNHQLIDTSDTQENIYPKQEEIAEWIVPETWDFDEEFETDTERGRKEEWHFES